MEHPSPKPSARLFRVKRSYLVLSLASYGLAVLPLWIVWDSPRPGIGGWIAFGALALGFAAMSSAGVAYALLAHVAISGDELRYWGVWRSRVVDLRKVKYVYASLGNFVIDIGEKHRVVFPNVFRDQSRLLEAMSPR
jgi:hypothetical protein